MLVIGLSQSRARATGGRFVSLFNGDSAQTKGDQAAQRLSFEYASVHRSVSFRRARTDVLLVAGTQDRESARTSIQ